MNFHPAAQIVTWCLLVAILQLLNPEILLASAVIILLLAMLASGRKLVQLLRRTRWIMLSLLIVYGYSTSGQPVWESLGMLSPKPRRSGGWRRAARAFVGRFGRFGDIAGQAAQTTVDFGFIHIIGPA